MPLTQAQVVTVMADTAQNPTWNASPTCVTVLLKYNINFDPAALRVALATIGTVTSDKDVLRHRTYEFTIS